MKKFIAGIIVGVLMTSTVAFADDPIRIMVNGIQMYPDVPPQMINGRTLVPIRFVAEALGADVQWDPNFQAVMITTNKNQQKPQEIDSTSEEKKQNQRLVNVDFSQPLGDAWDVSKNSSWQYNIYKGVYGEGLLPLKMSDTQRYTIDCELSVGKNPNSVIGIQVGSTKDQENLICLSKADHALVTKYFGLSEDRIVSTNADNEVYHSVKIKVRGDTVEVYFGVTYAFSVDMKNKGNLVGIYSSGKDGGYIKNFTLTYD